MTNEEIIGVSTLLTGGIITVNKDNPALFDISAGEGVVVDWRKPEAPVKHNLKWEATEGIANGHFLNLIELHE